MTLFSMMFLLFIETMTVYSTPKLKLSNSSKSERIEHEQLSRFIQEDTSSSEEYLSNDPVVNYLRNEKHEPEKSGAEGYIFNEKLCKLIKKRILCGYDRNKGEINEEGSVAIGKNCVIRNDRIECGYFSKPFNNSLYLRFKPVTVTESSTTTISMSNEISATDNKEQNSLSENSIIATESPVQLFAVVNSESTTYSPKTPESDSKVINTIIHQLKMAPTTVLNSSSPVSMSSNIPTVTTVKESDQTTLPSSFINFLKNLTTSKVELSIHSKRLNNEKLIENTNKTESVIQGIIPKLMNNVKTKKEIRSGKHIESIPPSKNCKCPFQALSIKHSSASSTKLFLNARKNAKSLRKEDHNVKIQTSCVENQDRIVCVDYKLE